MVITVQERTISDQGIDDLEARGIAEHGVDGREGGQDVFLGEATGPLEGVLVRDFLPGQALGHLLGSEEGPQGIDRVLLATCQCDDSRGDKFCY
jgi:hypothetical protein